MDVQKYLARINFCNKVKVSKDMLFELQKAHLLSVAFENLDIHYGNLIELDINKIYHKVVIELRGGFCYELNGLFYFLLRELGFDAKIISARVYNNKKEDFGEEYDHLAIMVRIDQLEYLVDVGYGEFAFHPLKFELGKILTDPRGNFVIEAYKDGYYKVSKIEGEEKSPEYIFTTTERAFSEFANMCIYHQTSPSSHFTQKKLISIANNNGRITLNNKKLKITELGIDKETDFKETDFETKLKEYFDIEMRRGTCQHGSD